MVSAEVFYIASYIYKPQCDINLIVMRLSYIGVWLLNYTGIIVAS